MTEVEQPTVIKPNDGRIIIRLSSHIAERYEICPLYFDLTVNQHYCLEDEAKYFSMGKFVHKILARYYTCIKEGKDPVDSASDANDYAQAKLASEYDLTYEEVEFGVKTFREYAAYYMVDKYIDEIIDAEKLFSKIIYEDDKKVILYEGTPDLIYRSHNGDIEVMDHKTEKSKRKLFGLNNQFLAYPFLLGVNRIWRNAIGLQKTKLPPDKFYREMYSYPTGKIEHWKDNMVKIGLKIIESYEKNEWEAHHSQCESNPIHRSGCMFQEVCRMAPANWQYELETEFIKVAGLYY